jgi:integrase
MKRSNGEGTIEWREERQRYVARVRASGANVTATGRTQSEAWDALDRKLGVNLRALVGLPKQPTLESWWEYARAEITLDGNARTAANRHANILRYVLPTLGHVRLTDLKPEHGERLVREVKRRGLSPTTQRTALKLARYVLNLAVEREVLQRNPFVVVRMPRAEIERRLLTRDEARELQEAARGDVLEVVPKLLLGLGLRSGELCGLEWKHVHLDGKRPRVEIRQQLQRGFLDAPKCGQLRTLPLAPRLVEGLEKHRARQAEVVSPRTRLERWDGHSFVVTTPTGAPLHQKDVRDVLQRIGAKAGLSPHPRHGLLKAHELRYTSGSLMLDSGADLKEVSVFLGHNDIRTTANVYVGLYDAAADRLREYGDTFLT